MLRNDKPVQGFAKNDKVVFKGDAKKFSIGRSLTCSSNEELFLTGGCNREINFERLSKLMPTIECQTSN